MKVFVTGGGGFLGFGIVKLLSKEGYEVVSYSRSNYNKLDQLGAVHIQGNLSDYDKLKTAMNGCEAVFHVAAKVSMWDKYSAFYETNVIGTNNIIKACKELNIHYLIFTSSPSVVFQGGIEGEDESLPYPKKYDAYYPQTKAIAEQAVIRAYSPSLITCSLRPHLVWGPGDHHFLPRLFEQRQKNRLRLPGKGDSLVDTIYIDNAVYAHLQAFKVMQKSPSTIGGKTYFLSQDDPIPIREFFNRLLETGDLPPVDKSINPKIALFLGAFFQKTYRLLGLNSEPPITPLVAKHLTRPHWYDISAAKRDLEYRPIISIDEGMERLKAWVEENY